MKILLVDDRPENLLALESILGSLGHDLVTASSGEQALRAVLREDFAVILLDVRMPGMDGFEVASHIRLRERSRDTPIIFLTAAGDGPHQTLRGYAAGAADYLTKPFDPWVLRAKVGVFAELHRKNRQLKEQAALLREAAGVTPRVLEELSERLSAIEGTLALLIEQNGRDGPVGRLERRVGRMRSALDAVRAGGVPTGGGAGGSTAP
ncbi:MAG: response regulator [Catenulispora sp. 13_1_20CM_3_70_7]|nr:MAG: response regulator [Catenulispora sp. 13_1_20CM_3_70_7]